MKKHPQNEEAKNIYQDPPLEQLRSVLNLYTHGKLQKALSESSQMLERFPNSVVLYNISGVSNAGLMQFDAAIDCYKKALKIKPNYAEAYYNMGVALKDKGDLEEAIDSYKQALKIKPDYSEAYNNMGNVLKDKGNLEAAIDSYKQALKIKPDYSEAYNNMGVALNKKGDPEAAIDSYKQALKIKPDYAEAYNNMGNVLKDKGELNATVSLYKEALDRLPNVYKHPAALLRGLMRQQIWDFEKSNPSNNKYFSQSGQDKIVNEVFFKNATCGFFLEIGAYDGITGSNCLFFEKFMNWDGIAVEASEMQFLKLEKNRNCDTVKAVISSRVEEVEFFEITQGLTQMSGINSEIYSASLAFIEKDERTQINKQKVITSTIENILQKRTIIDFMSIDIEGHEMRVLNSIDFEKYEFRVICVENNTPEKQSFNEFFLERGFYFFDRAGVDEIYFNSKHFNFPL